MNLDQSHAGSPSVQVRDAYHSYGRREVLRNINIDLRAGEIYGLLGPNGAGKTTLMKAMAGHLRLSHGSVRVADRETAVQSLLAEELYREVGGWRRLILEKFASERREAVARQERSAALRKVSYLAAIVDSTSEAIIGDSVKAISADSTTATVTVTPNSRNRRPTMPPMKSSGINTAISETVIDTIVKPISADPSSAACLRSFPSSMCRKIFSSITMASSTTSPTARVTAIRERLSRL